MQPDSGYEDTQCLVIVGQDITEFNDPPKNAHLIKYLDLSYNQLKNIDGVRKFVGLRDLILDNNNIADHELRLPLLPFLTTLSLNKNRLSNIDLLLDKLLKNTPVLEFLSLIGNPACPNELSNGDEDDYQSYRYVVINKLPYLRFLDSRPITPEERLSARKKGKLIKIVKALKSEDLLHSDGEEKDAQSPIVPGTTPLTQEQSMDVKLGYGKRKYRYQGKNSEGNKFIGDGDL